MAAAQAAENHGDESGLTLFFLWGIYASSPTWSHSQNSLTAAEAPSLKLVSAIFYQIFIFSSNDRPSKTMKNVFYFI